MLIVQASFFDVYEIKTEIILAAIVIVLFNGFYVLLGDKDQNK